MSDDELRNAFNELRIHDERRAPAWGAVRDVSIRRRAPGVMLRVVAAAVLVVTTGVTVVLARRPATLVVPEEVVALSRWRSPTIAFLQPPPGVLQQNNILTESIIGSGLFKGGLIQ